MSPWAYFFLAATVATAAGWFLSGWTLVAFACGIFLTATLVEVELPK